MEQGSDALSFYMRSLAIKEKSLGENSAELCDTLYNIAHLSLETDNVRCNNILQTSCNLTGVI